MITEVASTFIIVANMVLASGEEVHAYGEQYSSYDMCQKEAARQTAEMNIEIRQAQTELKHPVFKSVSMQCYDLSELEEQNIVTKGEFENED